MKNKNLWGGKSTYQLSRRGKGRGGRRRWRGRRRGGTTKGALKKRQS